MVQASWISVAFQARGELITVSSTDRSSQLLGNACDDVSWRNPPVYKVSSPWLYKMILKGTDRDAVQPARKGVTGIRTGASKPFSM